MVAELSDDMFSAEEWALVEQHRLDDQAVLALKRLGAVSLDAMQKVFGKLMRKADIKNASRFVSVSCRNAQQKLSDA